MSVYTPNDFPQLQDPDQFVQNTGRESYHWDRIPDAYRNIPGITDWANDPNSDPNAKVQQYLTQQRAANPGRVDAGDANALAGSGGGNNSSVASQWTQQPALPQVAQQVQDQAAAGAAQNAARNTELYNTLMGRATQALTVNHNDPVVRQQADAYAANEERARRNYLGDVAEGVGGRPFNIAGEARMASERVGQRTGTFEAQLIGQELTAKRNEVAQALQSMQGILTEDQRITLQQQLGLLDQIIKQQNVGLQSQQLSQQNDQFLRELALREWMAGNDDYYRRSGI